MKQKKGEKAQTDPQFAQDYHPQSNRQSYTGRLRKGLDPVLSTKLFAQTPNLRKLSRPRAAERRDDRNE